MGKAKNKIKSLLPLPFSLDIDMGKIEWLKKNPQKYIKMLILSVKTVYFFFFLEILFARFSKSTYLKKLLEVSITSRISLCHLN